MPISIYDCTEKVALRKLSSDISLESFFCRIDEYNEFLLKEALTFQDVKRITNTFLLIEEKNSRVLSYMSLVADSVTLTNDEKGQFDFSFKMIPALKIAKLAVSEKSREDYNLIGTFMIDLAILKAFKSNEDNMACRFITVDADVEHDPQVCDFYRKNKFTFNQDTSYQKKTKTKSMRRDIFE